MSKILKITLQRLAEMRKLKPLKICLMAISLSACASLPKFPTDYVYEVDIANKVCGRYKITNYQTLQFAHDKDLPLSACDGVFGFSSDKISPVLNWARDRAIEVQLRCK